MAETPKELPFKQLGQKLKVIRQKLHETASDVSGAVEIDENVLARYEAGHERPSEDILNLMISHFGMQEDDAASLWQLAGYELPRNREDENESDIPEELASGRAGMLVMAIDPRVIYTDGMHVNAGPTGVVLSFAQTATGAPQPLVTARVGMSREQARNVIRTLQGALDKTEPRELPAGKKPVQDKSDNATSTENA
ncbi:MAG: helix-turn-helix domain-containing protein [Candidatus Saccharibacteria bacterium]